MRSLGVSRPILIGLAPLATEMIAMTDQPLYAALDVSLENTTLCVMAHDGTVIREAVVPSDPAALAADLAQHRRRLMTIGLEAGPLSEWLVRGLAAHGLSAVLMETRQVRAALSARLSKPIARTPAGWRTCYARAGSAPCTSRQGMPASSGPCFRRERPWSRG